MIKKILLTISLLFVFTGCSVNNFNSMSSYKAEAPTSKSSLFSYFKSMEKVSSEYNNGSYMTNENIFSFSKDENISWFFDATFKLWNYDISKGEFLRKCTDNRLNEYTNFKNLADLIIKHRNRD